MARATAISQWVPNEAKKSVTSAGSRAPGSRRGWRTLTRPARIEVAEQSAAGLAQSRGAMGWRHRALGAFPSDRQVLEQRTHGRDAPVHRRRGHFLSGAAPYHPLASVWHSVRDVGTLGGVLSLPFASP